MTVFIRPDSFEALVADNRVTRGPIAGDLFATLQSKGKAAGLDADMLEAIALDERVTSPRLAEAAVEEACTILSLANMINKGELAEKYDVMGVARDFIVKRLPESEFRRSAIEERAALDVHIDTYRREPEALDMGQKTEGASGDSRGPFSAFARGFWSKRGAK